MASKVLPFGAWPSDSLPTFIASFSHPIHIKSDLSEDRAYPDVIVDKGSEREAVNVDVSSRQAQEWLLHLTQAPGEPSKVANLWIESA